MIFIKIVISIVILCITSYIGIELASSLKEREEMVKLLYEQYQKVGCALDKLENKDGEF